VKIFWNLGTEIVPKFKAYTQHWKEPEDVKKTHDAQRRLNGQVRHSQSYDMFDEHRACPLHANGVFFVRSQTSKLRPV